MRRSTRNLTLAASTALASLVLAGCATNSAPRADLSAGKAEVALRKGKATSAIAQAEAAVLADPRNPAYRTLLGAAYLDAGRFQSALTSFDDAMELGDESARTALGFALAAIAVGDQAGAIEVLGEWRDDIPPADLGLALALAGQTAEGVHVLTNAVRGGDNTPKARQNLAYALALNGSWAGARIMAAEDVPADQLDARMAQWAANARAQHGQERVAALLGTPLTSDAGQPAQLALANYPAAERLAAAAVETPTAASGAAQSTSVPSSELPAVAEAASAIVVPAEQPAPALAEAPRAEPSQQFQTAFADTSPIAATPGQMLAAAVEFVSQPLVQEGSIRASADQPPKRSSQPATRTKAVTASGNHFVQLGSFTSEASARRAWDVYAKRYPQLAGYNMVLTKAVVSGKAYVRVSAGGLARSEATSVCSTVRSTGQACYTWSAERPMPGAVAGSVRMAQR